MSDDAIELSLILEFLMLDDMRPSSRKNLTRMMDYCPDHLIDTLDKQTPDFTSNGMLNVQFNQSSKLDKNITICVSNLLSILNVEFIMVLIHTMLAAIPKDEKRSSDSVSSSPTHSIASSDEDADTISIDDEIEKEQSRSSPEVKVQFNLRNPQVVLLADGKDDKTNALFLTTEVNFQYLEINDVQKMMGTVVNTAVLSTAFQKQHRTDISTVLSLETINLHSSAPIGGMPHMHIGTSFINLSISPKTIHTLSACASQTTSLQCEEDIREAQRAMMTLWNTDDITEKKMWYLNTPPQSVLSAGSFVLARTKTGQYKNGFLAKKDSHCTIYFYPEGQISHSVSDVSSVVVDVAPTEDKLSVGENVVALHSSGDYRTGRVMQVSSDILPYFSPRLLTLQK